MNDYDWGRLQGLGYTHDFLEKMKDDPCWKGYQMVGHKKKGGRIVPNCIPMQSKHSEINQMTARSLPSEPIPGGGDKENPQMAEGIRMPRMEEIKKAANKNSQLAMHASVNDSTYAEVIDSTEKNGGMAINQLRVMQEKIQIMLDMLTPDDNLEPWMASKLTMSSQNLASVADYLRFGVEH